MRPAAAAGASDAGVRLGDGGSRIVGDLRGGRGRGVARTGRFGRHPTGVVGPRRRLPVAVTDRRAWSGALAPGAQLRARASLRRVALCAPVGARSRWSPRRCPVTPLWADPGVPVATDRPDLPVAPTGRVPGAEPTCSPSRSASPEAPAGGVRPDCRAAPAARRRRRGSCWRRGRQRAQRRGVRRAGGCPGAGGLPGRG